MNYFKLPLGDHAPDTINAVVEVPAGQANKYEYDQHLEVFRLDRPLFTSVHYPGDYGFIPSTRSSDGDPLDVLILVQQPTFPGCLVQIRPVGVLALLDQGIPDEKLLAVAASSPIHQSICSHADLEPHVLREVEHFFTVYKQLEGKHTEPKGWQDVARAHDLILQSHARFSAR